MRSLRSPLDVFLHLKRQPQLLRTFLYAINIVYVISKYNTGTLLPTDPDQLLNYQ